MKNSAVSLVLAFDNNFAPYAAVTIQSIIEHADNKKHYDIYILHAGLSQNTLSMLTQMSSDNVQVKCIDVKNKIRADLYHQERFSKEIFFRFLIPEIFPEHDKILYLDSDLIVKADVAELFSENIDHFAVAGVVNPSTKQFADYCQYQLKISKNQYINSGVLLINVRYWIKHKICDKVWGIIGKPGQYVTPDQDIINLVCFKKIKYVDPRWNAINPQNNLYMAEASQLIKQNEITKNAKILHYALENKPWRNPDYLNTDIWWQYARLSPFYEFIIRKNF